MIRIARPALLAFVGILIVVPLLWIVVSSFKSSPEIFSNPWGMPRSLKWSNYATAWSENNLGAYFINSFIVSLLSLLILIPIGAMAAYVLTMFPFRGSQFLSGLFAGGMMFPNFLVIVPLFLLMSKLGLHDTKAGLIIAYVAFSLSFTIFVLRGFFSSLPRELAEAAELDGCSYASTFWKVMWPISMPGLAVVTIFNAIGLWNEYSLALVLISSNTNRTMALGIADLVNVQQYQADWGALCAGLTMAMVPVSILYWIFREKIQSAMLAGAIKG
ncbi:MAG: carbohydrate ABC transporter permease [Armatimonadetes bacterium]|nr:carbohydrate ABC transporter permease [Armatimonadota bacterium]